MRRLHSYVCVYVSETSFTFLFLFDSFDVFCILPLDLTSLLLLTQNNSSRGGTCRIRERLYSIHTHQRDKTKKKWNDICSRDSDRHRVVDSTSSGPLDGFDTENLSATTRWCCSANKKMSTCLLSCHFKGLVLLWSSQICQVFISVRTNCEWQFLWRLGSRSCSCCFVYALDVAGRRAQSSESIFVEIGGRVTVCTCNKQSTNSTNKSVES